MTENQIAQVIFEACTKIYQSVGPGLLEKTYEQILVYELQKRGLSAVAQQPLPIQYEDLCIENAYRMDILVEDKVVIELKAQDCLTTTNRAQLLTYLRFSKKKLGILVNFGGGMFKDNYKRIVNCSDASELDRE